MFNKHMHCHITMSSSSSPPSITAGQPQGFILTKHGQIQVQLLPLAIKHGILQLYVGAGERRGRCRNTTNTTTTASTSTTLASTTTNRHRRRARSLPLRLSG
jgi:hypothetical protein